MHFIRHGMVFPLIPLYAQKMGGGATEIGLVASSFNLLSVFLAIPIGGVIERLGMKPVLLLGVACNVLYALLLAAAPSLMIVMLAQICGGLGFLFLIVSSQTYVSHMAEDRYRERGFGFLALTAALGFMLGPPLGGALSVNHGYRFVFTFSGILAASGLVAFFLKKESSSYQNTQDEDSGIISQMGQMLKNFRFVSILIVSFTVVFVVSLRNSFLPVLLKNKQLNEMNIGLLYAIFALAMTAVRVSIGRVMGIVGRDKLLALTLLLLTAGFGFLPLLSAFGWLGVLMFLGGLGFGISQPLTMVMVSDHSGSGLAMGVRFTTITLATVLSPLFMGGLVHTLGLNFAFYAGALMIICLGILFLRGAFSTRT